MKTNFFKNNESNVEVLSASEMKSVEGGKVVMKIIQMPDGTWKAVMVITPEP